MTLYSICTLYTSHCPLHKKYAYYISWSWEAVKFEQLFRQSVCVLMLCSWRTWGKRLKEGWSHQLRLGRPSALRYMYMYMSLCTVQLLYMYINVGVCIFNRLNVYTFVLLILHGSCKMGCVCFYALLIFYSLCKLPA